MISIQGPINGVALNNALTRIATAMERDQERQDGELVMRYLSDKARWEEAVKQCAVSGFDLLTATEQEYRTERRDDLRQALDHFMIAYSWIVERVHGEDGGS